MTSAASDIEIRELHDVAGIVQASELFDAVWTGEHAAMPSNILRAMQHAGNYVVGAYRDGEIVAASAAFFGPPEDRTLHSHVTGVRPGLQGTGVGRLLKRHQREWALARGVERITWTFDPLIARNAHFNLAVLGASATEYLVDHYGAMADEVNRGDATDRILVSWELTATPQPVDPASVRARVPLPPDAAALRRSDPAVAAAWRLRVREALLAHLAAGRVIAGFDGAYLLTDA